MTAVFGVAVITWKEGVRTKAIYGIFLLALLLFLCTHTFSYLFMRDVVKVAVDVSLSGAVFGGLLLTLFLGTNLIAKDLDKRTIHVVLAKAVSRPQYLFGKFLGLSALIATAMTVLGAMAMGSLALADIVTPDIYGTVHWFQVAVALTASTFMLILLSSIACLFAAVTSNSFVTLGLTVMVYFIGQTVGEMRAFLQSGAEGAVVSSTIVWLVEGAYHVFPSLSAFDFKSQASHGMSIDLAHLGWVAVYGAVYTTLVLSAAAWLFNRKEFT
jgi:ABC-type transport system involved in multi-copper enzyme maturation permease subunit